MCTVIDGLVLQVSAHWRRALVEVTWMGELLDDEIPQILMMP